MKINSNLQLYNFFFKIELNIVVYLIYILFLATMIFLKQFKHYCSAPYCINDLAQFISKNKTEIISIVDGKKTGPCIKREDSKTSYNEYKNNLLHGVSILIEKYGVKLYEEWPKKVTRYAEYKHGIFHGKCILVPPMRYSFLEYGKDYYIYCDYVNGYTSCVKVVIIRDGNCTGGKKATIIDIYSYMANTCINIFTDKFFDINKYKPIPTFVDNYVIDKLHTTYKRQIGHGPVITECRFRKGKLIYYKNIDNNIEITYKYDNNDDSYNERLEVMCAIKMGYYYTTHKDIAKYRWNKKTNDIISDIAILPNMCQFKSFEFENNNWEHVKTEINSKLHY